LKSGVFLISLDFELYWGIRDKTGIEDALKRMKNKDKAVNGILQLFEKYDIHATWATAGFLFLDNYEELIKSFPEKLPSYKDKRFSPYEYILRAKDEIKANENIHFAPNLIRRILNIKGQEIATHTFSHYYTLEEGQKNDEFREDLLTARKIAKNKFDLELKSVVFPRNQYSEEHLKISGELGFKAFRGNPLHWAYKPKKDEKGKLTSSRGYRLLNSYFPLNYNTYQVQYDGSGIVNLPSSVFLRPYSKKLRHFEYIKYIRIDKELKFAAKNNLVCHLWWHPHNFMVNMDENLKFLEKILKKFNKYKKKYGMKSLNMNEASELIKRGVL